VDEGENEKMEGVNKDDVNLESSKPEGVETWVKEKLVYYCSSFDLNINEWFSEYENIEIFKRRMKRKLGNLKSLTQ